MKQKLIQFVKSIIQIGANRADIHNWEKRFVTRTNYTNLVALVFIVVYAAVFIKFNQEDQALILGVLWASLFLVFWFLHKGLRSLAKMTQILILAGGILYFGSYLGRESGAHYLLFVYNISPLFIFDLKEWKKMIVGCLFMIIAFSGVEYEWFEFTTTVTAENNYFIYNSCIWLAFIWSILNFFFYLKTTQKNHDELKLLNTTLKEKNTELENYTYITSHDLQEPIGTIKGFSEMLLDPKNQASEKNGIFLGYIQSESDRLEKMVHGLMLQSRFGRFGEKSWFKLQDVLLALEEKSKVQLLAIEAKFQYANLPSVYGIQKEIELVFQHILENSIKFRSPNRTLQIEVKSIKRKGLHYIEFIDNGIGVEEKHLKRVFKTFQRLHEKSDYDGQGIGLSHCKRIIELHKGQIWMESELNSFCKIHIVLP
jgi:signal transduction histidine kinase